MKSKKILHLMSLVFLVAGFLGMFTPAEASEEVQGIPPDELQSAVAYRINAGGAAYTASSGALFIADQAYSPGGFGYTAGKPITTTNPIAGTADDPLFQVQRSNTTFSYLFDNLPAGNYAVTLHFAEIQVSAPGQRRFDVAIEGSLLLDNYDIFVAAGGANIAIAETFVVAVSDGQLNIDFTTATLRAALAALEVTSSGTPEPAPDIAASPAALNFGDVFLGSSSDLILTVSNQGTLDLHVSALTTTNPAFSVVAPVVPFTITPGNSTPVTVRFTPVATGPQNGDLQIASDDPDEPTLSVPLSGNGIQPPADVPDIASSSLIRIMPVGDSITVGSNSGEIDPTKYISYRRDLWGSLVNAGHQVDFVGSLVNGEFYGDFDPDHEGHAGWRDDQVAANIYNWLMANPADAVLLHIGTNSLSPSPTDVENILNEVDRFEGNTGTVVTVVLARIINRTKYSATTTEFNNNVAAMAQTRIANGDQIVIVDMENGAGLIYKKQPTGDFWDSIHPYATGYSKMAVVWRNALSTFIANINFGNVNLGTFSERTITISNVGGANLNVSGLSTTNPVFTVVSPAAPFTIPPGNSVPVTVRFTPSASGTQTGSLQIASNDPDEPTYKLSLRGNGVQPPANEPDISITPTSLDFGQVVVGSSTDRTLTISNLGAQTLTVSSLTSSDSAFTVVSPATPFDVAPSADQVVTLRFSPISAVTYSGSLQLNSNDPDEPSLSVSLSGQGINTPAVAYRINAGGAAYTASSGALFIADQAYSPGGFGYTAGKPITTTNPIAGTADDPLFQVQRSNTTFSYLFDNLPAGNYAVTLHFAEIQVSAPGQRRFDVAIEGSLLLDNYDIFVAAGGANIAIAETFVVAVSDGQLNIDFTTATLRAALAALEVTSSGNP